MSELRQAIHLVHDNGRGVTRGAVNLSRSTAEIDGITHTFSEWLYIYKDYWPDVQFYMKMR